MRVGGAAVRVRGTELNAPEAANALWELATLRWQAVNPLHEEMVSWHNAKSAFLPCTHTA